jgi:hypothetical protein
MARADNDRCGRNQHYSICYRDRVREIPGNGMNALFDRGGQFAGISDENMHVILRIERTLDDVLPGVARGSQYQNPFPARILHSEVPRPQHRGGGIN